MKCPLISSIFLKKSLVFHILLFFSICLHYSFKKTFLPLFSILWNSALSWVYLSIYLLPFTSVLSWAIFKPSSDNHFAFLHLFVCLFVFFFLMIFFAVSCTILQTFIHSSSWTTSTRSNPFNLSPPLNNHKGYDLDHTWIDGCCCCC